MKNNSLFMFVKCDIYSSYKHTSSYKHSAKLEAFHSFKSSATNILETTLLSNINCPFVSA